MNATANLNTSTLCRHCTLPVGRRVYRRTVNGKQHDFCCYGCCLAFQVHHGNRDEAEATWLLIRLGVGAFLAMNIMLFSLLLYSGTFEQWDLSLIRAVHFLLWLLATPVLVILGWPFLRGAWGGARDGRLNADTLITLGAAGAYGYSAYATLTGAPDVYFDTATMVLVLFTAGRYLEAAGRARGARSLEPMLQPGKAWTTVAGPDGETRCRVRDVVPGMTVRIRPAERIPVDGIVREGMSHVDEAMLTGESCPVTKRPGTEVFAGTLNHEGGLSVEVTSAASATRWAQICHLVLRSISRKSPMQCLADRVAGWFVPAVVLLASGTVLYWGGRGPFNEAFLAGLAVLVVACPCALALATPLATSLGITQALRRGCLVRGGAVLEALAQVKLMGFDKTGTLTTGRVRLFGVEADGSASEAEVLQRAAALEQSSEHPLARGILDANRADPLPPGAVTRVRAEPGRGIVGLVNGEQTAAGTIALMHELAWQFPPELKERRVSLETVGYTQVYVGWNGCVHGVLLLHDMPRPEAPEVVDQIRKLGLVTAMLTGDTSAAAQQGAAAVGVDTCRAELSPEDKVATVKKWTRAFGAVAMVGDGLNDGPVLSGAAVGIAVGSATDLARETADVVLPDQGIRLLPWMVTLSRRVRRTIISNLAWAFGYNLVALALAALGLLQPVLAAGLMAGSSLFVVVNSLRLEGGTVRHKSVARIEPGGTPVNTETSGG